MNKITPSQIRAAYDSQAPHSEPLPHDGIQDGLYFGLPFEEYLAERRLSFHGCKHILVSPLTFWSHCVDPTREDVDTKARMIGRAFHARILEGEAVFKTLFAVKPENDGEYAEGGERLREMCGDLGLKKSGTIAEMCARILEANPEAKLWPERMKAFYAENAGKDLLTDEQWRQIEIPARTIHMHPEAQNAFRGGHAEVSVLWTDPATGVRMKCRVDYLKIKSNVELKTFSNQQELPISKAVARAVTGRKYHMQARIQIEAIERAKQFVAEGNVHGPVPADWLKAFAEQPEHQLVWVFIQQGAVPEVRLRKFARHVRGATSGATENLLWTHGWDCYREALRIYRECIEHYGPDPSVPWLSPEPMRPFQDEEFGAWAFE